LLPARIVADSSQTSLGSFVTTEIAPAALLWPNVPLRALDDFDVLHVIECEQRAAGLAGVDAILIDADRRIGADAEVADADAAQRIARLRRLLAADEARDVASSFAMSVACSDSICLVDDLDRIGTSCTSCVRLCAVTVTLPSCARLRARGIRRRLASAPSAGRLAKANAKRMRLQQPRRRDTTSQAL
jgi:hypothetical protein